MIKGNRLEQNRTQTRTGLGVRKGRRQVPWKAEGWVWITGVGLYAGVSTIVNMDTIMAATNPANAQGAAARRTFIMIDQERGVLVVVSKSHTGSMDDRCRLLFDELHVYEHTHTRNVMPKK